jgi:hypothetical protein
MSPPVGKNCDLTGSEYDTNPDVPKVDHPTATAVAPHTCNANVGPARRAGCLLSLSLSRVRERAG